MKRVLCLAFVCGLFLIGCVLTGKAISAKKVAAESQTMQFGSGLVNLPDGIPNFSRFQLLSRLPIYAEETLAIVVGEAQNPENGREFVTLVVVIEASGKEPKVFLLGFQYSVIPEKADATTCCFLDKTYLETGVYSGVFTEVDKLPNPEKFIALKKQQLAPRTDI